MCSGFSTIAGSLMGSYILLGANPGHLLTAAVMTPFFRMWVFRPWITKNGHGLQKKYLAYGCYSEA